LENDPAVVGAKLSSVKTNSSGARSTSFALRRTLPALDDHGLGAKDHVAENVGFRRFPAVARGECGFRQSRPNASCMDAICLASSSVSEATMATWRLDR
jgi:hypothetical protein